LELDQEIMTLLGVRTTILSVTAPGACILKDSKRAARLARECNEYAAAIRDARPGQYGFFASLPPLCDTQAALNEISYALTTLKADGVTLFTRYGSKHHYLGHSSFRPIWAELSRRKAVVFVHPTHAVDTQWVNSLMPQPIFDYPQETGRTAMDLITSRVLQTYPGCKVILSHAGGTLPYLIHRAASLLASMPTGCRQTRNEMIEAAREFYFDTALSGNAITLPALLAFAKPGHVLFGSDFPNAPREAITQFTDYINSGLSNDHHSHVCSQAGLALFPRLRPHLEKL
jgi:predicted TIM-barrel fold metal-dependent hydrolase